MIKRIYMKRVSNNVIRNNSYRSTSKRNNAKSVKGNLIFFIGFGLLLPILAIYLYFAHYFQDHFYNNTFINGVSVSNMTVVEVEDVITAQVKSYNLTIVGRNEVTDTIEGAEIDLHTVFEKGISDLVLEQKRYTWPISVFKTHNIETRTMLDYDEVLLEDKVNDLEFLSKENNIKPVNAAISEYGEKGYEIVPEKSGAYVDKDKLHEVIRSSVEDLNTSLDLEQVEGIYAQPKITSEYPALVKAYKKMKRIAGAQITYEFGDVTEVLDGSKISQWITLDDKYKVHFDESGVKEFVDYIGKNYNSFGRERTFKTSYGDVIKVKGGDYGWWLNRPEEVKELTDLIKKGEKVKKEPVYFQIAQQYGKDDVGDTYVEVNLTAQHLFFYKEGKLILETDFVSGNLAKDHGTPVGTYPVQYKENDAVLVGEDYETPVKYWMPFNKNIGFHDASWRKEFGKDIYLTKGSHGCINMPPKAAKKMFENIKRGVAVVVYDLPGTENYEIEKEAEQEPKVTTQPTS